MTPTLRLIYCYIYIAFQDNVYDSPDAAKEDASTSEKPGRKGKAKATEEDPTQGERFITPHSSATETIASTIDPLEDHPLDIPPPELDNSVTYTYKSTGRKKKDKRSTSAGKGEQSSDTPLPSYYYATTNPEPDVCIEEYNVTAGATPHSTQHTVTPTQLK